MPLLILSAVLLGTAPDLFPPHLVDFTPIDENPVFQGAGPGHWDERICERGWILYEDGEFHLWYTGYAPGKDPTRRLGYATSPDGIHWTRHPANPLHPDRWIEDMMIWKHGETYHMFAEGVGDEAQRFTSTDRITWRHEGRLDVRKQNGDPISPGPFGTPTVFHENDTWYLFYERDDEAIWLASSKDMTTWTNVQDDPVLPRGPDPYDKEMIALDQIIKHENRYYAYYHGLIPNTSPQVWTSAIAVSQDLIHWQKYPGNPIIGGDKSSPILVDTGAGQVFFTTHPVVHMYRHKPSPMDSPSNP